MKNLLGEFRRSLPFFSILPLPYGMVGPRRKLDKTKKQKEKEKGQLPPPKPPWALYANR